jgi:hypothetical protein
VYTNVRSARARRRDGRDPKVAGKRRAERDVQPLDHRGLRRLAAPEDPVDLVLDGSLLGADGQRGRRGVVRSTGGQVDPACRVAER